MQNENLNLESVINKFGARRDTYCTRLQSRTHVAPLRLVDSVKKIKKSSTKPVEDFKTISEDTMPVTGSCAVDLEKWKVDQSESWRTDVRENL